VTKLIKIGQLSKMLNLVKKNKPLNHVLRYWEKQFKQIKPKIINKQRYYSTEQIEIIKKIKFLLKNKGMTITGVKNTLNFDINKLDDSNLDSLKADYYKSSLKEKSKNLLNKINKIKKYGKKNTS
tara:strand:- start:97 stop:471 length:375 start_codon:yes stop_codon:yes gene_type:complete